MELRCGGQPAELQHAANGHHRHELNEPSGKIIKYLVTVPVSQLAFAQELEAMSISKMAIAFAGAALGSVFIMPRAAPCERLQPAASNTGHRNILNADCEW